MLSLRAFASLSAGTGGAKTAGSDEVEAADADFFLAAIPLSPRQREPLEPPGSYDERHPFWWRWEEKKGGVANIAFCLKEGVGRRGAGAVKESCLLCQPVAVRLHSFLQRADAAMPDCRIVSER